MKEVLYESTNNNRNVKANSGSTELIDELSSAVVDRKVLKSQSSTQVNLVFCSSLLKIH